MELPPEITESLERPISTDPSVITQFWDDQLLRLKKLVQDAQPYQDSWNLQAPTAIQGAHPLFKSVASHQLLINFPLGGDRWMLQYIFGFPTTGVLSQAGVFPFFEQARPPMPTALLWKYPIRSFRERARASGHTNADPLWEEALSQVEQGWLCPPFPFSPNGDIPFFAPGASSAAFRFGVDLGNKLRACDDLRHNMVNLCSSVLTL